MTMCWEIARPMGQDRILDVGPYASMLHGSTRHVTWVANCLRDCLACRCKGGFMVLVGKSHHCWQPIDSNIGLTIQHSLELDARLRFGSLAVG